MNPKPASTRKLIVTYSTSKSCRKVEPQPLFCTHCGNEVLGAKKLLRASSADEPVFCCMGCKTVFGILNSSGLGKYYDLRKQAGDFAAAKPVSASADTYRYLDDPEFKKQYAHDDATTMNFYLEGVHCAACLWLIEKLPTVASDVESASLDIGRSIACVKIKPGHAFASAAKTLESLGYKPHAIERDEQAETLQKKENRSWLIRIGIAGASAGNIMLMTVPLYSGLDGQLSNYFRWISLGLFTPVFFYCALPFYKSAWTSIRTRSMSIDLPIVLAIFFGSAASVAHLLTGSDHIYFDSLAALVFLLLASRFVLRRIQQNAFHSSHLFQFLSPSFAKRIDPATGALVEVAVSALKTGDLIEVEPTEVLPVDGIIRSGSSAINCALLTGESTPQMLSYGDETFSGTVNESNTLRIEVTAIGAQTKLGKILKQVENGSLNKAKVVTAADKTAKWFLVAVFFAALATVIFAPTLTEGLSRALALVIVTCPCALALATPLTMSVALGKASKVGILIKGAEALEKAGHAKNIVLDKTGTLTQGHFEVLSWIEKNAGDQLKDIVHAIELKSKHPIAKSIVNFLAPQISSTAINVDSFLEQPGFGIKAVVAGRDFALKPLRSISGTAFGIYRDEILVGEVKLGDRLRAESLESVSRLEKLGLKSYIVSGDNKGAVETVSREVKVPVSRTLAEADPEAKKHFIENHPQSIMVGDGANDAIALSTALVGVAVHGSMEISLRTADVYLTRPGLTPVVQLVTIARETMKTIYRNFAFSLFYNLAGGVAAATGHVTPLFAACLMPLSAFTVFGSSLVGTRKLRAALKARVRK